MSSFFTFIFIVVLVAPAGIVTVRVLGVVVRKSLPISNTLISTYSDNQHVYFL